MPRYTLRDHQGRIKAIIYDVEVVKKVQGMFAGWTFEEDKPKVATVQPIPNPTSNSPSEGVEQYRQFDASKAITHSRRLSIHVSYRVQHNIRHYIAYHSTHGKVTAEVFDHDSAAHWFYQKLRTIWPAYTISK